MQNFCKKLQVFCKQPVKGNLHIFSFSWLKIRLFEILQNFLHIWNGIFKGFSKMYYFSFFGQFFFANIFTVLLDFAIKNSIFANLLFFLQILKVEHKSCLMMYHLSYLDIKHGIRGGGVKLTDPYPAYPGFQVKKTMIPYHWQSFSIIVKKWLNIYFSIKVKKLINLYFYIKVKKFINMFFYKSKKIINIFF